jgi:hypothetical protein
MSLHRPVLETDLPKRGRAWYACSRMCHGLYCREACEGCWVLAGLMHIRLDKETTVHLGASQVESSTTMSVMGKVKVEPKSRTGCSVSVLSHGRVPQLYAPPGRLLLPQIRLHRHRSLLGEA